MEGSFTVNYSVNTTRRSPLLRRLALFLAVSFVWSFVLAGAARAATYHSPTAPGHARSLTPAEMKAIVGAAFIVAAEGDAGSSYPWETSVGDANTSNGNKATSLPLVSWTARGGLPVGFTLHHNSKSSYAGALSAKWTFSYDIQLNFDTTTGNAAVHWGDGRSYAFTANIGGTFTPPAGIHDTLVANGSPITSYDLTTKDQVKYHFTNPNGTAWLISTISDTNANTITVNHVGSDRVTTIVDPSGRTLTLGYDASNRLSTVTGPLSRVWTLGYDAAGDLNSVAFPLTVTGGTAYTIGLVYNTAHDITTLTDKRGKAWTFLYNADDSLQWEKDPYLNKTGFEYGTSPITGLPITTVKDANLKATVYTYSSGRLSMVTDPLLYHEDYGYDTDNNRTSVIDKNGYTWNFTYDTANIRPDAHGNLLTSTLPSPISKVTTFTYTAHNKVWTKLLPGGEKFTYTYDTSDNLTKVEQKNAAGTILATTNYTIGPYGLAQNKTAANALVTSYGYDGNGYVNSVTTQLSHQTQWTYDAYGAALTRTDAMGRVTTYTLDGWSRTTAVAYTGQSGDNKTFTYDANSNLTGFTDVTGTTARVYDNANRIRTETKGGVTVAAWTYDDPTKLGLLCKLYDINSRLLTYSYTSRNQLYSVAETAGTVTYGYDANGNETGITAQNGATTTKVYDEASRLTSVTNKTSGGTISDKYVYGYTANSQRNGVTESGYGGVSQATVTYTYDGRLKLSSEVRTGASPYNRAYNADAMGNRLTQNFNGASSNFIYDNDDELTGIRGSIVADIGYNANGEQTYTNVGGVPATFAYDYEGQLTGITKAGATTSFTYDAAGRRMSRAAGGVTTAFQFAGSQVLTEKQGSTTTGTYTWGSGLTRRNGEYPLMDGLGSERVVRDASNAQTGSVVYDAFGQTVATSGSSANPYMFAANSGYRNDGDAGLMQVGARYYDPMTGRFITRDTVLTEHPYVYCDGDPVNCLDPSGHDTLDGLKHGIWAWVVGRVLDWVVDNADFDYTRKTTWTPGGGGLLPPGPYGPPPVPQPPYHGPPFDFPGFLPKPKPGKPGEAIITQGYFKI